MRAHILLCHILLSSIFYTLAYSKLFYACLIQRPITSTWLVPKCRTQRFSTKKDLEALFSSRIKFTYFTIAFSKDKFFAIRISQS